MNLETDLKDIVLSIINSGIDAVKPSRLMRDKLKYFNGVLSIDHEKFDLRNYDQVYVIGFGKVSLAMASEIENILGDRISAGLIITNASGEQQLDIIKVRIGSHPVPDENVLIASKEIIEICNNASENDLVICLISGGGSALFELLPEEINLTDIQELTYSLLNSGAPIEQINQIRKCFSLVKNGKLLTFIKPAKCISLIISDVVGDSIGSISSSPTYYNACSFEDSYNILKRYQMHKKLPISITDYLLKGMKNETEEPERKKLVTHCANNFIIGKNIDALIAAEETAREHKLNSVIISSKIQGDAGEIAKEFSTVIPEIDKSDIPVMKPACIIAGGETTVTVKGKGAGGRNQELVLAVLKCLIYTNIKFAFASCGTDGIDGVTNAAGGIIHHKMIEDIREKKLHPEKYLINNDSFHFLEAVDGLLHIPPGQTNVMDIMVGIIY